MHASVDSDYTNLISRARGSYILKVGANNQFFSRQGKYSVTQVLDIFSRPTLTQAHTQVTLPVTDLTLVPQPTPKLFD